MNNTKEEQKDKGRRKKREGDFDLGTWKEAMRQSGGYCSCCGRHDGDVYRDENQKEITVKLEAHHKLQLAWAIPMIMLLANKDEHKKDSPPISREKVVQVVKSLANAQVVCRECHDTIHREMQTGDIDFLLIAEDLLQKARALVEQEITFDTRSDRKTLFSSSNRRRV